MTQKFDCMVVAGGEIFGLKLLHTLKVNKNPDSNIQLGNILQLYERNIYFFTKLFRVYIAPFTSKICPNLTRDQIHHPVLLRIFKIFHYIMYVRILIFSPCLFTSSQALSVQTSWTLSRVSMSFKSLSGVLQKWRFLSKLEVVSGS